jgi:AcrR family transcriptional regulator
MDELPPGRRRGRPRDEASRQAILHAASDLLEERGYLQLTIEEIAAAAGVGKPTIYRWWPSKAELVIEAYLSRADARLSMPDSGRLDADLREYTLTFCRVLMETNTARAVIGLAAAACDDPTVAMAFRERFIKTRRDGRRPTARRHRFGAGARPVFWADLVPGDLSRRAGRCGVRRAPRSRGIGLDAPNKARHAISPSHKHLLPRNTPPIAKKAAAWATGWQGRQPHWGVGTLLGRAWRGSAAHSRANPTRASRVHQDRLAY